MRKKRVMPKWDEVEKFFMENMDKMSNREIAKRFDIMPDTLSKHMRKKGFSRFERKPWTKEEEDFIRNNYPRFGGPFCSEHLDRPITSVNKKASELRALYKPKDTYVMVNGYRVLGKSDNRKLAHRKVMEEKLGRELTPDEIVHHKDENKLNNHPDNLELMTRAEHLAHHRPQFRKQKRITRKV